MMHAIGKQLESELHAVGYRSASVVDGPETRPANTFGNERIVIEYDEEGADTFAAPEVLHRNPKHRFAITMACKLTIWAQAKASGAMDYEHYRRARHIADLALVALNKIAHVRKNTFVPKSGRFITPEDLKASEEVAGAVYELKFTFDRGVKEQTWTGDARPEGTIAGVANTTQATRTKGSQDDPPETGCGGA